MHQTVPEQRLHSEFVSVVRLNDFDEQEHQQTWAVVGQLSSSLTCAVVVTVDHRLRDYFLGAVLAVFVTADDAHVQAKNSEADVGPHVEQADAFEHSGVQVVHLKANEAVHEEPHFEHEEPHDVHLVALIVVSRMAAEHESRYGLVEMAQARDQPE